MGIWYAIKQLNQAKSSLLSITNTHQMLKYDMYLYTHFCPNHKDLNLPYNSPHSGVRKGH